jgi:hypothetical protein
VVPASGHVSRTGAPWLPAGVWEIANTASDHFFPPAPEVLGYLGHITSSCPAGQNHIASTQPDPLTRTDILGYRELYAALNLLSPV